MEKMTIFDFVEKTCGRENNDSSTGERALREFRETCSKLFFRQRWSHLLTEQQEKVDYNNKCYAEHGKLCLMF